MGVAEGPASSSRRCRTAVEVDEALEARRWRRHDLGCGGAARSARRCSVTWRHIRRCGAPSTPSTTPRWNGSRRLVREARAAGVGGGADPGFYVIDLDATLVGAHSEKEGAAPTYKRGFGFHPLLAYLDATGEALAGMLRPGNAGSGTAADHVSRVRRRARPAADRPGRGRGDRPGRLGGLVARVRRRLP